eukprot:NODE_245_length_12995_cov_0.297922.p2 type:complete len:260 gc:universal NODE_245_length_12995_cov_0.297922:8417-7638(-)
MELFSQEIGLVTGKSCNLEELSAMLNRDSYLLDFMKSNAFKVFCNASPAVMDEIEFFNILDKLCHFTIFKQNLERENCIKRIEYHLNLWNNVGFEVDMDLPIHELNRYTLSNIPLLLSTYPHYPIISPRLSKPRELKSIYKLAIKENNIIDTTRTKKFGIALAVLNKDLPPLLSNQIMPSNIQLPAVIKFSDVFGNCNEFIVANCCKGLDENKMSNCICSQKGFIGALIYKLKHTHCTIVNSKIYYWERGTAHLENINQ